MKPGFHDTRMSIFCTHFPCFCTEHAPASCHVQDVTLTFYVTLTRPGSVPVPVVRNERSDVALSENCRLQYQG